MQGVRSGRRHALPHALPALPDACLLAAHAPCRTPSSARPTHTCSLMRLGIGSRGHALPHAPHAREPFDVKRLVLSLTAVSRHSIARAAHTPMSAMTGLNLATASRFSSTRGQSKGTCSPSARHRAASQLLRLVRASDAPAGSSCISLAGNLCVYTSARASRGSHTA